MTVFSGEIHKLNVIESHIRLNDFDSGSIREIHIMEVAIGGILKAHTEMLRLVLTIKPDSVGIGADHGTVDGDEYGININS